MLADRWTELARRVGLDPLVGHELIERWSEPHRRYHDLTHLAAVLDRVDELLGRVEVADPDTVRLAAWFHDAVYEPSGEDEARSAELGRRRLSGRLEPARVDEVCRLVLTTVDHRADDPAALVLADADLAVLATEPAVYALYVEAVRAEYAHVSDADWRVGRSRVLASLLNRPRLLRTPGSETAEKRARHNLSTELAGLG